MAYTMSIVDMKGKKIKDLSLEGSLFADEHINEGLLHEYVVMYLANGRHAIAHTKTRGEVKRSGAKLYRQKGTGRARVGDAGSPIRRKGGVVFGPRKNASFAKKMTKKMKLKALCSALTLKAKDGALLGLDAYTAKEAKTKQAANTLKQIGLYGTKTLLVVEEKNELLVRSFNNIPTVRLTTAQHLNPYEVMTHKHVLFLGGAFDSLMSRVLS